MAQNNIEGSRVLNADGSYLIANQPFPVCGTVTVHVVLAGWTGGSTLTPGIVGRGTPDNTTPTGTIYQKASVNTDVASGTAITASDVYYFRLDGTRLVFTVSGYSAGTATIYWSWSQG